MTTKLTDERISKIYDETDIGNGAMLRFARAIEREIAAQGGASSMYRWLPIESVPTDGREVLLYLAKPYDRVVKARWFDLWENWIEGEFPDPQEEYCGIGSSLPTHWMPVPAKPAKESV